MTARRKVVRLCENKRICCLDALHAALFARQSARSPGWHAHPKRTRRARLPGPNKSCLPVRFSCHMRGRQSVIRQAPISWRWRVALAECRLKGFKQHFQARDRSAAHTSRTKTRPSRCLNGAAAADDQVLQQRSSGSSTRQVQGMPAGSPSCRFQGEDGEPRRTSVQHRLVATAVMVGAASTRQPQCTPVRRIFSGGVVF